MASKKELRETIESRSKELGVPLPDGIEEMNHEQLTKAAEGLGTPPPPPGPQNANAGEPKAPAPQGPVRYRVRPGRAITSLRGVIDGGNPSLEAREVRAKDLVEKDAEAGEKRLEELTDAGVLETFR